MQLPKAYSVLLGTQTGLKKMVNVIDKVQQYSHLFVMVVAE